MSYKQMVSDQFIEDIDCFKNLNLELILGEYDPQKHGQYLKMAENPETFRKTEEQVRSKAQKKSNLKRLRNNIGSQDTASVKNEEEIREVQAHSLAYKRQRV